MNIDPIHKEGFIKRKLVNPLYNFLKQGTSPEKLALAVALGAAISIFPMIGATTALCALIAVLFRLNMGAIQLVNYFMYPMQLLLYIPYFAAGSKLFGKENPVSSVKQIYELLKNDLWGSIKLLWWANMYALVAWLITAPFLALIMYMICKPIFSKVAQRITRKKQTSNQ